MAISGEKIETMIDFIFLGSKITAVVECNHEIKRCLLLGRKDMTNLGSILRKQKQTFIKKSSIWSKLWFFQYSCMDVRVGPYRMLSAEELMPLNCDVEEDFWLSLEQQVDQTSQS